MSCVAGEGGPTGRLHDITPWVCASSSLCVLQPAAGLHCTTEKAAPASCGSRVLTPAACRGAYVP